MSQNIALKDGDLVYVPRMVIGDINEFIANINPLMRFLNNKLTVVNFRDAYVKDPNWLKF